MTHKNEQLELAEKFVELTNKNIFLTGKAGTGKTTFLHNLKKSSPKRMAIVAPTGVAAINAGGVTIHSFFQLPFGPYVPGKGLVQSAESGARHNLKMSREKINLIRSIDLLVIDEISMVRADTLDSMDEVLRRYKNHTKPFGGVQLLMIGDLHQLSPVVKDSDWQLLRDYYPNLYFFNSRTLQQTSLIAIELKHIYRQSDPTFIDLLNSIRENRIDKQVLEKINERYIEDFKPADDEGYITLTTHNRTADEINQQRLTEIKKLAKKFRAQIKDNFPELSYPTSLELELKEGAQVMFVKNDSSKEKLFYNGKIGTVTRITDELIYVKCPEDSVEITVYPVEWQNIKYVLNPNTKEVEEQVIGSFTQHPLKLAWAITVHKSQGLTFEKAIIDAGASFAHGQVYVALSRCKTFEGIVLRSKLTNQSIRTDSTVSDYSNQADKNAPNLEQLQKSKEEFQQNLLYDLFDFTVLRSRFAECVKLGEDNDTILEKGFTDDLIKVRGNAEQTIYSVAEAFKKEIQRLLLENSMPEENTSLKERLTKACTYFIENMEKNISQPLELWSFDSDNKAVRKKINDAVDGVRKEIFIKMQLLKLCKDGFNTLAYLKAIADSETDYKNKEIYSSTIKPTNQNIDHPKLSEALKSWRNALAGEKGIPVYMILPQRTISELVTQLPLSLPMLSKIKGMGQVKLKQYGHEILEIISSYANDSEVSYDEDVEDLPVKKNAKKDTKRQSLELYKQGKTIAQIATERNLTITTIENHLISFISTGETEVLSFVSPEKLSKIRDYLEENQPASLTQAKVDLGDTFFYSEVRAVVEHLKIN